MTITALLQPACRYISDVLETGTSAERIVARTIMHLLPLGAIDSGKIVPMDRSDEMQTIEQAWEFWRPIICNEDGSINLEQLKLELCDAANFMGFAASVYDYATGGMCTKVNTLPSVVKALIDDHVTEVCEDDRKRDDASLIELAEALESERRAPEHYISRAARALRGLADA